MNILKRINNYINDIEYKLILTDNYINIINFDNIVDFTSNKIIVLKDNKLISIEGSSLIINKMEDNELLITGIFSSIKINDYEK